MITGVLLVVLLVSIALTALALGYLFGCRRASQRAVDGILERELDQQTDAADFLAALRTERDKPA